jgi:hypothetical protein
VLFQDRIANGDALVADDHTAIGRIRDQGVYLVLSFATKRTSEDFILFVALGEHDPSMPREWWKSRSAKVHYWAAHRAKTLRCSKASKDAALGTERLLAVASFLEANRLVW